MRALVLDFRSFDDTGGSFKALVKELFHTAAVENRDCLIIDLRANIGGNSFVANHLISRLASDGHLLLKSSDLHASNELKDHFLSFIPGLLRFLGVHHLHPWTRDLWRAEPGRTVSIAFKPAKLRRLSGQFSGRIAFLAGPGDYSSSAILLGAVKHYGFGTIVGEPSGGYPTHYGNCTCHTLPHSGLELLVPASVNHGWGIGPVLPDIEARPTQSDLAARRDVVLESALRTLAESVA